MQQSNDQNDFNPLTLKELTKLLIKHYEIHEGLYNLVVEFKMGVGDFSDEQGTFPSALVNVSRVVIKRNESNPNSMTVDASKVNPLK